MITTEQIDQILKQANADPELRAMKDLSNARMILEHVLNYTDDLVKKYPGDALVDMIFRQVLQSLLTVGNAKGLIAKFKTSLSEDDSIANHRYPIVRGYIMILEAWAEGKIIQQKFIDGGDLDWHDIDQENIVWDFSTTLFRVKP